MGCDWALGGIGSTRCGAEAIRLSGETITEPNIIALLVACQIKPAVRRHKKSWGGRLLARDKRTANTRFTDRRHETDGSRLGDESPNFGKARG